ncbi:acetyl/propionyl/methylcrotonyl-CoA carboxylase subunit alpha [Hwanghaeella sp.]|uniref:acetyl/propionyl/methylcrotonyl-CoA carboxylase subunit alpha n=1 Tax=Hwanghaeella sp. TaxID=2605943 RepID=UPI003CCBEE81
MFDKILIANRGEIACRVIRTARKLGVRTVAVYSDADAAAQHVLMADEAVHIGPPAARDSYLVTDKILEACRRTGAQAVHPGYGFLSENAGFARALEQAGIAFIGPPASAIDAMGSKSGAKSIMEKANVPLVPGYHGDEQDAGFLAKEADRIGYPVLIKASAGGGGKGMRLVEDPATFADALASCRREAAASFGDDKVLVERFVTRPRHIEIQVFADSQGNAVHLFERDCSLQRRHQKVIEESPAPFMSADLRAKMGAAATEAAKAIGYVGAGTVEFIVESREDGTPGEFFFMEMNTRLQVEHPVTEMVTGQDLVEWQLSVAAGGALPLQQDQIRIDGHAFEARLYAEDPANDFLPSTGRLARFRTPETGEHVRIDSGVVEGDTVSVHYDPMIAKVIAWDRDRGAALQRLRRALEETEVAGLTSNRDFLIALCGDEGFAAGQVDTGLIGRNRDDLIPGEEGPDATVIALAALNELKAREAETARRAAAGSDPYSPWSVLHGWRLNDISHVDLVFRQGDRDYPTVCKYVPGGGYEISSPAGTVSGDAELDAEGRLHAIIDGTRQTVTVAGVGQERVVILPRRTHRIQLHDPMLGAGDTDGGSGKLTAPMPGKVTAVFVKKGDKVEAGKALMILEAMKMEHTIAAPVDGTLAEVHFQEGDQVDEGVALVAFEE